MEPTPMRMRERYYSSMDYQEYQEMFEQDPLSILFR